jgi:hypothetical protein
MGNSDSWRTPDDLFNILNNGGVYQGIKFDGFNFDIDLCATKENSKCSNWYRDYLKDECWHIKHNEPCYLKLGRDWIRDGIAFMNPPYSNPLPFIKKAWEDARFCRIVALVKVDPSTKWWGTFWNYTPMYTEKNIDWKHGGPKPGCSEPIYFPKRVQFDPPRELVNNGEVWKVGKSWVKKCRNLAELGYFTRACIDLGDDISTQCKKCKGAGYTKLSGPSFASCVLIFDRREL